MLGTLLTGQEHPWAKPGLCCGQICVHLFFTLLPPYHGKKNTLLSLISRHPAQAMGSDHLCVSCSALASESWTDGQHQDGGAARLEEEVGTPSCAWLLLKSTVNFPCAQLQHGEGAGNQPLLSAASAKLSQREEVRFAGSEEKRQGAGPMPLVLTERERTQAVYSFRTWDFHLLELKQEIFQYERWKGGKECQSAIAGEVKEMGFLTAMWQLKDLQLKA